MGYGLDCEPFYLINFLLTYLSTTNLLIYYKSELAVGFLEIPMFYSQNWLHVRFPCPICSIHAFCQVSSFVDRTRVILGPSALCAPEQFKQTKTPKSIDAHVGDLALQSAHLRFSADDNNLPNIFY